MPNFMSKQKRLLVLKIMLAISLAIILVFIFNSSADEGTLSQSKSMIVTEFINKIMANMGTVYQFTEYQVRKLAHFTEYMALGFLLILNLRVYTHRISRFIAWPLFLGLFAAVMDEFLQSFVPGRSSLVTDVVIDFSGVLTGLLWGLLAIVFANTFRNKRKQRVANPRPKQRKH